MKKWFFLTLIFLISCTTAITTQLDIPYHKQTGPSCVQSQMIMAIKYFSPDSTVTQEELDQRTGRGPDQWTWFSQAMPILLEEGLDAHYYSLTPYNNISPETVNDIYGAEDGELIKSVTNWEALDNSIQFLNNNPDRYEYKKLSWQEVEDFFQKRYVILMLVDYNVIINRSGTFAGHGVTITNINQTHVIYHNSNTGPNQVSTKETFLKAWNAKSTDNDVIVIKGKL